MSRPFASIRCLFTRSTCLAGGDVRATRPVKTLTVALLACLSASLAGGGVCQARAAGSQAFSTRLAASMTTPRYGASAAPLADGRILVVGGAEPASQRTAELFDPAAGTFTALGAGDELTERRYFAAVTALPGGDVLIAGGVYTAPIASAELFDPSSGTFSSLGSGHELHVARSGAVAAVLPDGEALIVGGEGEAGLDKQAELFDPATDSFTVLAGAEHEMREGRSFPVAAALPDGKILIAGGASGFFHDLETAEVFDPATDTFTTLGGAGGYMSTARTEAVAAPLASGDVLIAGGSNGPELQRSAEVFDPTSETFTPLLGTGQSLTENRTIAYAAPLRDGQVLIGGGSSAGGGLASAELLDVSPAQAIVDGGEFGAQTVGRSAGAQALIVDAVGAQPLSIAGATLAGADQQDFLLEHDSCEGLLLSFRQTCAITVGFTPSAAGTRTAALVLDDNELAATAVPLSGTGVAPESALAAAPAPHAVATSPAAPSCAMTHLTLSLLRQSRSSRHVTIDVACGWRHLPSSARAKLTRGAVLFAAGTLSSARGAPRLTLRGRRTLGPGRYTLTLITGHGWSARGTQRTVTVGA